MRDRDVSVHYVSTDGGSDELCARLSSQLHMEEQTRAARFLKMEDRLMFAAGGL